jgi:hypothetical protein
MVQSKVLRRILRAMAVSIATALVLSACSSHHTSSSNRAPAKDTHAQLSILPAVFPATSAEVYDHQYQSFYILQQQLYSDVTKHCLRHMGFVTPSRHVPLSAHTTVSANDYPNITQLRQGSFGLANLPPGSFKAPSGSLASAEGRCAKQLFSIPAVARYIKEFRDMRSLWAKKTRVLYAEPTVLKSLHSAEQCLAAHGVTNDKLSLVPQAGGVGNRAFVRTVTRLIRHFGSNSSQVASLAHVYGVCITPTSRLLDKLRLKARKQLLDVKSGQVRQLLDDANNMVKVLGQKLG